MHEAELRQEAGLESRHHGRTVAVLRHVGIILRQLLRQAVRVDVDLRHVAEALEFMH